MTATEFLIHPITIVVGVLVLSFAASLLVSCRRNNRFVAPLAESWRRDLDSEPFAHGQFWAVKPGWCILHGVEEPCFKCNLPPAREEVAWR